MSRYGRQLHGVREGLAHDFGGQSYRHRAGIFAPGGAGLADSRSPRRAASLPETVTLELCLTVFRISGVISSRDLSSR